MKHPLFLVACIALVACFLTGCNAERNDKKYIDERRAEYSQFLSDVAGDTGNAICSNSTCAYKGKSYYVGQYNANCFNEHMYHLLSLQKSKDEMKHKREACLAIAKSGNEKMYRKNDCDSL